MLVRRLCVVAAVVLSCALSGKANAQEGGQVRLQLDKRFLRYSVDTMEIEGEEIKTKSFTAGFISKTPPGSMLGEGLISNTDPDLNFGVGYAITGNAVIGTRLGLGVEKAKFSYEESEDEEEEGGGKSTQTFEVPYTAFSYSLLPYFELGASKGVVRPFGVVTVGLEGGFSKVTFEDDEDDEFKNELKSWSFAFGGGAGVRIVPFEHLSIDLTVLAKGAVGKLNVKQTDSYMGETETEKDKIDLRHFDISGNLGLSVWI